MFIIAANNQFTEQENNIEEEEPINDYFETRALNKIVEISATFALCTYLTKIGSQIVMESDSFKSRKLTRYESRVWPFLLEREKCLECPWRFLYQCIFD
jgi:hypothetical protein